jgi:2,5-diamino-6-(ribosylamino)-4(3H)-pyrimidinone 5'-phosphate reductase
MRPKITIYNVTSLDGRLTGFRADLDLYYGISSKWGNDGVLVGSGTVLKSMDEVPKETENDRKPPKSRNDERLPYVIFVDSLGRIRSHHVFRHLPYIREVLVLISKKTPLEYRSYLEERKINYIEAGEDRVDLKKALEVLRLDYGLKNMRSDSGGSLNSILMREGLVDRIVILLDPVLAGGGNTPLFNELSSTVKLRLESMEKLDSGQLLMSYEVVNIEYNKN